MSELKPEGTVTFMIAPPERYSFLKIPTSMLPANFIGALPKEGDRVEIVCTGLENEKMQFMLRVSMESAK